MSSARRFASLVTCCALVACTGLSACAPKKQDALPDMDNALSQEEKDVANHPNDDFDICGNADHCQNFDDDLAYELVQDVVDHVIINSLGEDRAIIVLYQPEAQTYEFACANFFGACLGMGTDNDSYNPELKAKPCTDWDGLPLHESTRKKGMCQAGAAYKAINGTNAGDILRYYYDNCNTFYCVME